MKLGKQTLIGLALVSMIVNGSAGVSLALDCNNNGVDDVTDIAAGTSHDCNTNGIPDECETFSVTTLTSIRVASGLSSPVFVTAPPGDFDRVFIVEQPGRIRILTGGSVLPTSFLDIAGIVSCCGERGLLSIAFHPDYDANGYFYVNYTNNSGNTVIARYSVSGNPDVADSGSALILKTINQDYSNHNGGQIQFGPDGYLYVGMGDGGSGGDPNNRAQNLNSLLGKMLRLDVDAASPYIPPSNPFVGVAGLDEIWAYGLRNPWRFSFDLLTGDMYIADVGQSAREEIDFQPAGSAGGENYGWRCYEGNLPYNTSGCDAPGTMVFPILEYSHSFGCSITGGYVYRGCAIPDLAGTYFYSDYCSPWIKTFRYVNGSVTDQQDRTAELAPDLGSIGNVSSFGEDAAGELYICDLGGEVFKIVPVVEPGVCGDGKIDTGEQCDDGNTAPGDGCDENCQFETSDAIVGGRMYDKWWAQLGLAAPGTDHPLWQFRPDLVSNTRTGSATWRCKECHGWDYKGVDGQYASGTHRTGIPGILGTTLTEQEMFDLLKEPPNNGGGPGVLNGHDFGSVLTDAQISDVVGFARALLIDDDLYIGAGTPDFLGSPSRGEVDYTTGGSTSCITCHGADGTALNFGTPEDPEWLGTVASVNPWEFIHKVRFGQPGTFMPSWIGDGGNNQSVANIGRYVQLEFPTGIPGDFDYDGNVDLDDFAGLVDCLSGPDKTPAPTPPTTVQKCLDVLDFDDDTDVDLGDFAVFQAVFGEAAGGH